ncbi:MAG: S-adenosylmethionine:tRNA ribosyltransferase-isomerase, partial [Candidatus Caldatribacteriaceae bacterium]
MMDVSAFTFDLPPELIAQRPVCPRDTSRLMVLDRKNKTWEHRLFFEIEAYLSPGDVLVVNESKVLKARLLARKGTGGKVEVFFVRSVESFWECLLHPSSRVKVGQELLLVKNPEYRWVVRKRCGSTWL